MKIILKKMLLGLCLGVLVPFALLESGVRLFKPHWDLMEMTGRRFGEAIPNPMATWAQVDAFCAMRARPGNYGTGGKTVNSHGFMSTPELAIPKPPGTIRIAFLGGSSTAGTGWPDLADEQTWPFLVAEQIQTRLPEKRIEYINAGLPGFATPESLGRLQARVRYYEPDAVVVYHAWNDLYFWNTATATNMIHWRVMEDGAWTFDRTTKPTPYVQPQTIDPWIAWSQLLVRVRMRIWPAPKGEFSMDTKSGESAPSAEILPSDYDPLGPQLYRTNLRLIREASQVLGAELFAVKQATLIVPGLSQEDQDRCYFHFHGFDYPAHLRAFDAVYRIIDDEIDRDHVIDVTPVSGIPDNFGDHIHPTPKGARAIADLVAAHLLRHMDALQDTNALPP